MNKIKPGLYKHSKTGNLYKVLGVAVHSETLEELVIYEACYENIKSKLWVRPLKSFLEKVMIDNKKTPRFKFLKENVL